jgi:hypothetical protein
MSDTPAPKKACGCCVLPCAVSYAWLCLALLCAFVGWGFYIAAIVYAKEGLKEHGHTGAWIAQGIAGFLIVPLSWIGLSFRYSGAESYSAVYADPVDREHDGRRQFVRALLVTVPIGVASLIVLVSVPLTWFEVLHKQPVAAAATATLLAVVQALHSTPTGSAPPAPPSHAHTDASAVGVMLLLQYGALLLSTICYWQYGENWLHEQRRVERGEDVTM